MRIIAGAIGDSPALADHVQSMAESLSRRGESTPHRFSSARLGCYLTWAGFPTPKDDVLPIWDRARDAGLLVLGEDFSSGCRSPMAPTKTRREDEPERLIRLYAVSGERFLERLNGRLSGVLLDARQGVVILFNDRFGLERLYYRRTALGLLFASDAKALLEIFGDSRRLDPSSAAEVVAVGCVMQGRTLFPGIEVLPPATCMSFRDQREVKCETYFSASTWEKQDKLSESAFEEAIRDVFSKTVRRYLAEPGQIGMSLTGGLDGRLIMAWSGAKPGELPCYSFGSTYRDCHDVRIARRVARACSQSHQTLIVGQEFITRFPELASRTIRVSDGTMDVTGAVELYVNELAGRIAPIRLTGNYGSEIMRGNVAFRPRRWPEHIFEPEFVRRMHEAAETYRRERDIHDLTFIAFKQVPWHHYARFSVERSEVIVRSPYLDSDLVALMYQCPVSLFKLRNLILRLINDGNPLLADIPTDRGFVYGHQSVVGKLRNRLAEFSSRAEYAYDYGMPSWLARLDSCLDVFQPERLFLGRHKFYHFRTWYRRALAEYLKDMLLNARAAERSFFRPGVLNRLVKDHTNGRANFTLELHQALTFELIHQQLLSV